MTLDLLRFPAINRRQRFHEIDDSPADQAHRVLACVFADRRQNHAWTCWNPGNALPLQDRSVEVWPRRENLHLVVGTFRHTTGAAQKASLYSMLDKVGSMTHRSKNHVRAHSFHGQVAAPASLKEGWAPPPGHASAASVGGAIAPG